MNRFASAVLIELDQGAGEVTADANGCFRVDCGSNDANPQESP